MTNNQQTCKRAHCNHNNFLLLFFCFFCNEHKFRKGEPLKGEWTLLSFMESAPIQKIVMIAVCTLACLLIVCHWVAKLISLLLMSRPTGKSWHGSHWKMKSPTCTNCHNIPLDQDCPHIFAIPLLCSEIAWRCKSSTGSKTSIATVSLSRTFRLLHHCLHPSRIGGSMSHQKQTMHLPLISPLTGNQSTISHQKQTSMSARMIVVTAWFPLMFPA